MKLIFFAFIVSVVFTLNVTAGDGSKSDPVENLSESELTTLYNETVVVILNALYYCNTTWSVPYNESLAFLENGHFLPENLTTKPTKCLMDCMMRELGIMTNDGFDVDYYMVYIQVLRFNVSTWPNIYNSTEYKTGPLPVEQEHFNAINKYGLTEKGYETIETYQWAANECKDITDPEGDKCVTSWMVARCIVERSRERNFNNAFLPIVRQSLECTLTLKYIPRLPSNYVTAN